MRKRILAKDIHKKWLKDPAYREAYDSLAEEFALAAAVIEARSRAGLTQEELAERMGTELPSRWWHGSKVAAYVPPPAPWNDWRRPPAPALPFASSLHERGRA